MSFVFGENKELITVSKEKLVTTIRSSSSYMEGQLSKDSSWLLILQGHLYFTQTIESVEQRCKNYTTAVYEALQWADEETDRETLYYAWQVWKLVETLLCVYDKGLVKKLQSWLWITQNDLLQSLESCELAIEENDEEILWKTVFRLSAIGDYSRAIDLIYRWQGYDQQKIASSFLTDSDMDIVEMSPSLIAAAALFEAPDWDDAGEEDWKQWQAKVSNLMKMRPVKDELYTLLEILSGKDIQLLANVVTNWHEMLLAVIIYVFSSFEEYPWDRIIALVNQYYTLPTQLHSLIALLQGNYTELIADVVHLKSFWHAAHLSDLLYHWKDPSIVVYDKEDIRKYYILEYVGSLPIYHVGILPVIRDYCQSCGKEGWSWLEQRLVYSLPWNSCEWDTLEDWLLDDRIQSDQRSSILRLQYLVTRTRMNRQKRYFDCLYGFCRLGKIDMIQRYLDNPFGLQEALDEKNIHQVVHILQTIFYVMKAANVSSSSSSSSLLDTNFRYLVPWLQLAQCVQQQDIQHAMEYFATMIACCAMGTKNSRVIEYAWQLIQLAFHHNNNHIKLSLSSDRNVWMDIVAGIQNMKTMLADDIATNEMALWTSIEESLLQWFAAAAAAVTSQQEYVDIRDKSINVVDKDHKVV